MIFDANVMEKEYIKVFHWSIDSVKFDMAIYEAYLPCS